MDLSCSARLITPFIRFASNIDERRELVPSDFWSAQTDTRVSLEMAKAMLDRGVEQAKDDSLGLRIGTYMRFGSGGTFDYVVRSSPNLASAVSVASKYARLLSDDFQLIYEKFKSRSCIRLEGVWPHTAADFAMGSLYSVHMTELAATGQLEAWFPISAPTDRSVYEATLPGAILKFDAPFYGFAMPEEMAEVPLPGGDPEVHQLLVSRADRLLEELSQQNSVCAAVHRLALRDMQTGGPTPEAVARALHMSPRTLSRRLAREGKTFNLVLDEARMQRSRELLRDPKVPLTEVAFLLGFSHVESFYRAFKRWTGTTPLLHRNALLNA